MCDECVEIQSAIDKQVRALSRVLDPLSKAKISAEIADLRQMKSDLHPPPRPKCPKCQMNMIVEAKSMSARSFECLRCGHIETRDIE